MGRSATVEVPETKPVVTDATDPETVKANNTGGPSFPGDMPEEIAKLFAGTNFDPNGTITKATLKKHTTGKGRKTTPLDDRSVKHLTECLKSITGDAGNETGAVFGYIAWPKHEQYVGYQKKVRDFVADWIKDNTESGVAVAVGFSKHPNSPIGYDSSKTEENKGMTLVYTVTLTRSNEASDTEAASE